MDLDGLLAAVEDAAGSPGASRGGRGVFERTGPLAELLDEVCSERRGVNNTTLRRVVNLAVEIAREGREGRKIGTLFVVGDSAAVLEHSRPMILDPLYGHPHESKRIKDPDLRETLKELAQLDGAFVVSDEGVVLSGARYTSITGSNPAIDAGDIAASFAQWSLIAFRVSLCRSNTNALG
jgi:DNA integrity scanning protein DisA with diadenylate cyclase activity